MGIGCRIDDNAIYLIKISLLDPVYQISFDGLTEFTRYLSLFTMLFYLFHQILISLCSIFGPVPGYPACSGSDHL